MLADVNGRRDPAPTGILDPERNLGRIWLIRENEFVANTENCLDTIAPWNNTS